MIKTVRTWDELPPVLYDGDEGFSTRVLERKGRELERRLELMWAWMGDQEQNMPFLFTDTNPEADDWFDEDGRVK